VASVDLAVSSKQEQPSEAAVRIADLPRPLLAQQSLPTSATSGGTFTAVLGFAVVASILALSIYFAVRYLL
jgi:hypothetical protein